MGEKGMAMIRGISFDSIHFVPRAEITMGNMDEPTNNTSNGCSSTNLS